MKTHLLGAPFIGAVLLLSPLSSALAQDMRAALTAASAQEIVQECQAFAKGKGWRLNIAVLDQGRNLQAFLRMDGAPLGSIEIAQWKANATASFPRATKSAAERAQEFPALGHAPNIAIFEGGEPIFTAEGSHIGGVGVSGARGSEDAECARVGIEAAGLLYERPDAN
ncbi:MAG: hypothetical protein DHS20C05_07580 [Hyphococcus sp.]|nr:MAG: hypothetical protein DHS20C05_07580 [Marinicaulis sp.]